MKHTSGSITHTSHSRIRKNVLDFFMSISPGIRKEWERILDPVRHGLKSGFWLFFTCLRECVSSVWREAEPSSAPHAREHLIAAPAVPPALYYSSDPTWNSTAMAVHLLYSSLLCLCMCVSKCDANMHERRCFSTAQVSGFPVLFWALQRPALA